MAGPTIAAPRPRMLFLSLEDPERAIDDPALAALARDGWTVHVVGAVQHGREGAGQSHKLALVVWPPPARAAAGWVAPLVALAVVLGAAGAVLGLLAVGLLAAA